MRALLLLLLICWKVIVYAQTDSMQHVSFKDDVVAGLKSDLLSEASIPDSLSGEFTSVFAGIDSVRYYEALLSDLERQLSILDTASSSIEAMGTGINAKKDSLLAAHGQFSSKLFSKLDRMITGMDTLNFVKKDTLELLPIHKLKNYYSVKKNSLAKKMNLRSRFVERLNPQMPASDLTSIDANIPNVADAAPLDQEIPDLNKLAGIEEVDSEASRVFETVESYAEPLTNTDGYANELASRDESIGELEAYAQQTDYFKDSFVDSMNFVSLLEKRQSEILANDMIPGLGDKLATAQKSIAKLKNKYSEVTSSKDVIEGREKPRKFADGEKRVKYGLNFQLQRSAPVTLDLMPSVSYMITRRLETGFSLSARYALMENKDKFFSVKNDFLFGLNFYSRYFVKNSFFIDIEMENRTKDYNWKAVEQNYLIGIGKYVSLGRKMKLSVLTLYDLSHKNDSYPHPFVVRFGLVR